MLRRNLKTLIVTDEAILDPSSSVIGDTYYNPFGDPEAEDFVEILSASNMPFDIAYLKDLTLNFVISDGSVNYSMIILAIPAHYLHENHVKILKQVSYEFGVSILASAYRVDDRFKEMFGITKLGGKKHAFPVRIRVSKDLLNDHSIEESIALGDGCKIEIQKWGFRRSPVRYLKIHFKKIWEQARNYRRIIANDRTQIFAVVEGKGEPAIIRNRYGKGLNYYVSLDSDTFLDSYTAIHRIAREIIRENSGYGMVECDLGGTMALRMDDPGSCERVYLDDYDTRLMNEEDWESLLALMKEFDARFSVMYVPRWVDDGNLENGTLFISGKEEVERKAGTVVDSKDVVFHRTRIGKERTEYNYAKEFNLLKQALETGYIDIESHGMTHVDRDVMRWSKAEDRYTNLKWYYEFRNVIDDEDLSRDHIEEVSRGSAEKIRELFGISPTTIAPSGHEQCEKADVVTRSCGYTVLSSQYTSYAKSGKIIRNDKIQSCFLDTKKPDRSCYATGYPVIGIFHDYDIVKKGVSWLASVLKGWQARGIERFITMRELAGYLNASLEAFFTENEIVIQVDISDTTGVTGDLESSYFHQNSMYIRVTLPHKMEAKSLIVNGESTKEFTYVPSDRKVTVEVPPFRDRPSSVVRVLLAKYEPMTA